MNSIIEAFAKHSRDEPERIALLFEGQTYSYGELYQRVRQFAAALQAWGLQRGERVALFLENCPEFVIGYLGTHLAGGVVVLVNTLYRQVELRHILTDSGARLALTDSGGATELSRLKIDLPQLEGLLMVGGGLESDFTSFDFEAFAASASDELPFPAGDELATIGYTSGTTGRAKGAMLLHSNLASNVATLTKSWGWTAADRLLLTLPLFHAHGLMVGLHGTFFSGASADLRHKFEAAAVLDALQNDTNITMFFGVPTMYGRLLAEAEARGISPRHLRLFVSGSAPLSPQAFYDFERVFGQRILERYGMTETIMNTTNPYDPADGERRAGTVGRPFPGQEARIVDVQTRQPLPDGETGEIEVRGPHVFKGYWQRPEATAEAFGPDGWFKTGDLGSRSPDGYYTISGRARELIISGGYNIYPREVEEVLARHPTVAEVAVVGRPDTDMGEQVVAYVVAQTDQKPTADELITYCREYLAVYKKPRQVIFVESLPRNALGKVQKHLL